jgi:hypothetical protein
MHFFIEEVQPERCILARHHLACSTCRSLEPTTNDYLQGCRHLGNGGGKPSLFLPRLGPRECPRDKRWRTCFEVWLKSGSE